ncbi:hypothetical protein [Planobispora longispora]|uniref:Uncharacterized protein n=1 Tax=Planobispora longispora TaxID=28887 RepID=A0A8J3W398_9ACTN|nr:hypothetical protein [Planobispora longispora]BFE89036.1 hypothetical protein GCM10020093_116370 [Planobispora longispora]GIH74073.1 hypothetical protein Plo01_05020 [Planobispora longispora]
MLRTAERIGDRLLSMVVPRAEAKAYWCLHCTLAWSQRCYNTPSGTYCTYQCMSC